MAGIEKPKKMQGHVFLGPQKETPREYLFAGRDRGDETVLHIRTVRDKQYRYLVNKYPERPFFQINRYKEARYPIISLMRDLHEQGSLTGPPTVLMADSRPAEELYDITSDPWEVKNLAADPKYAEVKARLKKELTAWGDRINDTGRTPESPEIIDANEKAMQRHYDKELKSRPKDWYKTDASLGPYKVEKK